MDSAATNAENLRGDVSSKRAIAAFMDANLAVYFALGAALLLKRYDVDTIWLGLAVLATIFGYFFLFETLFARTPAKWFNGLKVISVDGRPCTWWQVAIRNLLRIIEIGMAGMVIAGIVAIMSRRGQRIGDMVAGTLVIESRNI